MSAGFLSLDRGRLRLDLGARQVFLQSRPVKLGARAFDLLVALARNGDRVVPKQELLASVWPGLVVEENNLHVQVMNLRRVLGDAVVINVSGRGYRLGWMVDPEDHQAAVPSAQDPRLQLFGREALLDRAFALLRQADVRLLTLTGVGGGGKTRLALRLAERATAEAGPWADGVFVTSLAALRDGAHVAAHVARSLGLHEAAGIGADDLVLGFLMPRRALLVLDNLEHLPGIAAWLAELLARCPQLKLLATSRRALHLQAEQVLAVAPLALPKGDTPQDWRAAPGPALALLQQRALEAGSPFDGSDESLQAGVEICRRLDGLPLAIELAAARLGALTPAALAQRLGLPLLSASAAVDRPQRQRTLRHAIGWSLSLLDDAAQALFRRLAVFAGSASLGAVEAVGGDAALDAIETLLGHHLVQRVADVDGQPRYAMLETIREYALEQLQAQGEHDSTCARQAAWALALADRLSQRLCNGRREPALALARAERDNLRVALQWALRVRGDGALGGALVAALGWWWYFDDAAAEAEVWATAALALPMPEAVRARALVSATRCLVHGGKIGPALAMAAQALEAAGRVGDLQAEADVRLLLAIPAVVQSRQAGVAHAERCLEIYRELGLTWQQALATAIQGMVLSWHPGSEREAECALLGAYERLDALGDPWVQSTTSHYLALLALRVGDLAAAERRARETLALAEAVGYGFLVAGAHHHLAHAALAVDDLGRALHHTCSSIACSWRLGHRRNVVLHCRWLAVLMWRQRRLEDAVALFAVAADGLDENLSIAATILMPADREQWLAALADLRLAMPDDEFQRHWAAGSGRPLEAVLQRVGVVTAAVPVG